LAYLPTLQGNAFLIIDDQRKYYRIVMSTPNLATALAQAPAPMSHERSKEELELAERLIEHSQGIQHTPLPNPERRTTPSTADGASRSGGDVDRLSDDGGSDTSLSAQQQQQQQQQQHAHQQQQQNLQLPSIHELTWVKQRKPFNTGMGGAGQVCRCVATLICRLWLVNSVDGLLTRPQ
jgi:GATA-binding protein